MHQAIREVRINVFRERYNSMKFDVMQLASPVRTSYLRRAFNFQDIAQFSGGFQHGMFGPTHLNVSTEGKAWPGQCYQR